MQISSFSSSPPLDYLLYYSIFHRRLKLKILITLGSPPSPKWKFTSPSCLNELLKYIAKEIVVKIDLVATNQSDRKLGLQIEKKQACQLGGASSLQNHNTKPQNPLHQIQAHQPPFIHVPDFSESHCNIKICWRGNLGSPFFFLFVALSCLVLVLLVVIFMLLYEGVYML